jgi:ferredoxin/flavodoxin---NADP+ reductase
MSTTARIYDLLIVGAGPTGLFAGFYAGLREMATVVVDSLDQVGGQLAALYPEKDIFDVAGFPRVPAKELVDRLHQQMNASQHPPTTLLGHTVSTLSWDESKRLFTVGTRTRDMDLKADPHFLHARSIIVSAGIGAFRPRTLPIPGVESLEGKYVHYSVRNTSRFKGQKVLIVGGGDSAVDWANHLANVTASTTLIHRRDQFRAHEGSVTQMRKGPTQILTPHELVSLQGDDTALTSVTVRNTAKKEDAVLPVDHILVNIGYESSLGPIAEWGLEFKRSKIVVDSCMRTTRPGVFAAGDVVTYEGKLALIACGFGDAVTAVCHAKQFIDPAAKLFPGHSSER